MNKGRRIKNKELRIKKGLKIAMLVFISCFLFTLQAKNITATTTDEVIDDIKETVADEAKQTIRNKASDGFQWVIRKLPSKVWEALKTAGKKIIDLVKGNMNQSARDWFEKRIDGIKQGLKQERGEFEQDIEQTLLKLWEKIKNSINNQDSVKEIERTQEQTE